MSAMIKRMTLCPLGKVSLREVLMALQRLLRGLPPADLLDSMKIAISMSDIVKATIFSKELYPCFDPNERLVN